MVVTVASSRSRVYEKQHGSLGRDGLIEHHRVYWGWYSVRLYETFKPRGH